jgi:3-phenylpropionate/trans-cinnamate dioxygenase ferredoxin reductase subunit
MKYYDVLIVGAGHGGTQVATALRQQQFAGTIALLGDEADPPYERPPLSKDYLLGIREFARLKIRPDKYWAERQIELLLSRHVTRVGPVTHQVTTASGENFGYGVLVWATGGAPRRLSCVGHELPGVHTIRTREDVDRLMVELPTTQFVVVIGGGYIGLEAAAVLTRLGKSVTVLEAQDRVLARVAGEPLSRFYEAEHRAHGVDVRLNVAVSGIEERDGRACGVRLADETVVPADKVIVGIGITPAIAPLLAAGADGSIGVDIDRFCQTSLPDVYALGDCAAHANPFAEGRRIRLESVQNANDQATTVAKAITGNREPYRTVPWFWSDQFDLKLQTVGLSHGHDQVIVRGTPSERRFSVIYLRDGKVIAVDCVNMVRDYIQGKKLILAGLNADPALLADPKVPLKSLVEFS